MAMNLQPTQPAENGSAKGYWPRKQTLSQVSQVQWPSEGQMLGLLSGCRGLWEVNTVFADLSSDYKGRN